MEECKLWEEEREFSQYYTVYVFCNMHIFVILFVSFFIKKNVIGASSKLHFY